ncbi:MAG: hydantoinase/oxoprolinase family protein [Rhodospirillales bacterium]|jgi:N-methylhydantoinase A|nr:hydantoinase/oxoprolinase family protein [Rhodospirillales bacterium]MDP6772973.1 hydantoinase/oxoprolinase family protein [Rhodospirillales bacterium]
MAIENGIKRLAVDIGGTFTDVVVEFDGRRVTSKVLTTREAPEEGVLTGFREVLGEAGLSAGDIGILIHGTTLATNAMIERKGALTALITTEGFRDILEIGQEDRYDQYDIFLEKKLPLVPRHLRLCVPERVDIEGAVLLPLDEDAVRALVPELQRRGVESIAIGFLHSYANAAHEERTRDILAEALPGVSISISSEVCPEVREYERLSTTTANAYVQPLMARYLTRLAKELAALGLDAPIFLMTSGGGLAALDATVRFPIRLVESGPAGGAILASRVARECGFERVLSFDMGGTTAKICLIDDYEPQASRTFEVDRAARFLKGSGLPLRIPVIEMVEIGAGGGSIASVDSTKRIAVGPESAGAEPGPACYARGGGAPTVTDADVTLGRIDPERFAGGTMHLDTGLAGTAIKEAVGTPLELSEPMAAFGITEIVDENMANAARVHAIERGKQIGEYTLIAFGGAAPLHACRLADKLGIGRVVVPTDAGVGSAVGFLCAPVAYDVVRSRYMTLLGFEVETANTMLDAMRDEALSVVRAGAPEAPLAEERTAFMRYVGQGHEIEVELPERPLVADDSALLKERFDRAYESLYARTIPDADVEILSWAIRVSTGVATPNPVPGVTEVEDPAADGHNTVFDPEDESFDDVPTYGRAHLAPGTRVRGPAVITEDETSTFVSAGFDAHVLGNGYIELERRDASAGEKSQ